MPTAKKWRRNRRCTSTHPVSTSSSNSNINQKWTHLLTTHLRGVQPLHMPNRSYSHHSRPAYCICYLNTECSVLHAHVHGLYCQGLCETDSMGLYWCDLHQADILQQQITPYRLLHLLRYRRSRSSWP